MNNKIYILAASGVLLLSLIMGLVGLDHGLPFVYDPDEPVRVELSGTMLANRDLNPHWFGHPASTTIYLMVAVQAVIYALGLLTGRFNSPQDYRAMFHNDPSIVYLAGRFCMVVFFVLVVFLVIRIGSKAFSRRAGILAGLITALSPLLVSFSKVIRSDIMATFFLLLACWFCVRIFDSPGWKNFFLAGVFTGMAAATKYPAVIFTLVILLAYLMVFRTDLKQIRHLLAGAGGSIAGFVVSAPFLVFSLDTVFANLAHEARTADFGTHEGIFAKLSWYIQYPLVWNLSLAGLLLVALGLWLVLRRRSKAGILIASFPLLFLVFISSLSLMWERWIIPTLPFFCLLIGYSIDWLHEKVRKRMNLKVGAAAAAVLVVFVILPLLQSDLKILGSKMGTDTRTEAAGWILENIPHNSNLLLEVQTPFLPNDTFTYYLVDESGELVLYVPEENYKAIINPSGLLGTLKNVDSLRVAKIDYVIRSHKYESYKAEQQRYPDIVST